MIENLAKLSKAIADVGSSFRHSRCPVPEAFFKGEAARKGRLPIPAFSLQHPFRWPKQFSTVSPAFLPGHPSECGPHNSLLPFPLVINAPEKPRLYAPCIKFSPGCAEGLWHEIFRREQERGSRKIAAAVPPAGPAHCAPGQQDTPVCRYS